MADGYADHGPTIGIKAAHTAGRAAHRTDLIFFKADDLAIGTSNQDLIFTAGQLDIDELIILTQLDGELSFPRIIVEIFYFYPLDQALLRHEEQILGR